MIFFLKFLFLFEPAKFHLLMEKSNEYMIKQ
jgi:hypothetical protein